VCDDLDTLLWLANIAALEINITLSKVDRCENPDLILFDIDPSQPASFKDAADVSLILKEKLDDLGLKSYVKTTGKRGLHVVVPIVEEYPFEKTREFSHQIGIKVAKECEIAVSEFSQSKIPGKVFIDYLQNAPGKTMIAPYSLRAVESATISMPLEWKEVKKLKQFNIFSTRRKNPWEKIFEEKQKL
jgi:bifunctional non-homologous end joining protein LigD